jgi:hypothetical protein
MKINIRNIGESQLLDTIETDSLSELKTKLAALGKSSAVLSIVDDDMINVITANGEYRWMPTPAAEY